MPLMKLDIPPGMYKQGTDYQSASRWINANLVRWFEKTIRAVGGWITASSNGDLDGPGRGMVTWRLFNNGRAAAIGTPNKLWYFDDDQLHDITPSTLDTGNVDTIYGTGYGSADYGENAYGSTGSGGRSDATAWSLANFGQYLLSMASHDGQLFQWLLDPSVRPTVVTNSPTGRAMFVTPERFPVVLGADDTTNRVKWPDLDNITNWTASATNQAGDYDLQTKGAALAGCAVRGQSLILTTVDAWTMTYVQPQVVYSFQQVGYDCGLIAGNALVPFLGGAAWMSYNGWLTFNGGVVAPIAGCDIADYVFRDLNLLQRAKCSGWHNSQFHELIWEYPSLSTGDMRSVTWNYIENHWALDGQPSRTCGADRGVFEYPMAVNTAGRVFRMENGWTNDGASRVGTIFAETGPIEIGNGDGVFMIRQCIPDELTAGQWELLLGTRFTPEGTLYSYGPYPLLAKTNMRVTARQAAIKLRSTSDGEARIGTFRFDGVPGGAR